MAKGYQLIQAQTLTSNASSVTFANIPQNFTDLKLVVSARSARVASWDGLALRFNSSTGTYTDKTLYGNGTSATSFSNALANYAFAGDQSAASLTANTFSNSEIIFPSYTGSNPKSYAYEAIAENNGSFGSQQAGGGLWSGTGAITQIDVYFYNANILSGSTFYLYGIGGTRATGGTITSDNNYTYHTFTSSGTFTALEKIKNAEVLLVAGGGGGGGTHGGGGGAGGVVYAAGQIFTAGTSYTSIVGAGGTAGADLTAGGLGGNSLFASLSATGGGGGGRYSQNNATSGGSGGGAAGGTAGVFSGASGVSGQGYAGGSNGTTDGGGGGGGGAGGVGLNGTNASSAGSGGVGTSSYHYWHLSTGTGVSSNGVYYIAGGGAGGSAYGMQQLGGFGGGGTGSFGLGSGNNGSAGTTNTGSGGGGGRGSNPTPGNAGGSGLVIVRYPNT